MVPKATCAFVTFTTREAAETVVEKLSHSLNIKGHQLKVSWSKPSNVDTTVQVPQNAAAYPPGMGYPIPPFFPPYPMFVPGYPMPPFLPPVNQDPSTKPYYPSMDPNFLGAKPSLKPTPTSTSTPVPQPTPTATAKTI